MQVDDEVVDFSSTRKVLRFRVDDDVFDAASSIAADLALEYAELAETLTEGVSMSKQREVIHALFRMVLLPESADRFIERMSDQRNPIGHDQITRITQWLFEEYGLRPTEADSASSTGSVSQVAGTSSTVAT